jgi:hypothetical protein
MKHVSEKIYCCSPETPIRDITASLKETPKTIFLVKDHQIQGVIRDYDRLIEEHAYPGSPVPIGSLLGNALRASFLVDEARGFLGRLKRGRNYWLGLQASSKEIVAWLACPDTSRLAFSA